MALSENGWTVDTTGAGQDKSFAALGVKFPNGVRLGPVAWLFTDLVRHLNAIETIRPKACWGWFVKHIEGAPDEWSNHASGTAIDYNADIHGYGKVGTWGNKAAAVRKLLKERYKGLIRWGGDYHLTKDEMHFEINGNNLQIQNLVNELQGMTMDKEDVDQIWEYPIGRSGLDSAEMLQTIYNNVTKLMDRIETLDDKVDAILAKQNPPA